MNSRLEQVPPALARDCGVAARVCVGQSESGDRHVLEAFPDGALVAVIDALGHGRDAAYAADVAAWTVERHARDEPAELLRECHARLRTTRGAAISLAWFDWQGRSMRWLGIGNVAGALVAAEPGGGCHVKPLLVRGGVVGDYRLPELRPTVVPLPTRATLVLATDGVRTSFLDELAAPPPGTGLRAWAEGILGRHAKGSDDALVVAFDCGA